MNLAAITAALCAVPDANRDPARRYWSAVVAGGVYVVFGLLAGLATALIAVWPPVLIEAVAGLALLGAFGNSLLAAVSEPADREAAVITFLVAASGYALRSWWSLLGFGCRWGNTDARAYKITVIR